MSQNHLVLAYVFTRGSFQTACVTQPVTVYTQHREIKYMPLRLREIIHGSC